MSLRDKLHGNRRLAMLLIAFALAFKAIVPAGFMVGTQALTLTVQICADASGELQTRQIVIPREGQPAHSEPSSSKSSTTCPFTSLWASGPVGELPAILAAALSFLIVLGFAPTTLPLFKRVAFLRPPLRGPPLPA